jgi:hypothetical protein
VFGGDRLQEAARRLIGVQFMSDLKTRLAALLASPEGKAIVEEGMKFSTEELQAAFAQVQAEADGNDGEVIKVAMNALMARKAN